MPSNGTVSRLLAALRARGWVQQNGASRYSLGPRLLALARQSIRRPDLRETARPYLEELQRRAGEDVHLGVLSEGQVLCVDRVDSAHMVRMFSPPVVWHRPTRRLWVRRCWRS